MTTSILIVIATFVSCFLFDYIKFMSYAKKLINSYANLYSLFNKKIDEDTLQRELIKTSKNQLKNLVVLIFIFLLIFSPFLFLIFFSKISLGALIKVKSVVLSLLSAAVYLIIRKLYAKLFPSK